MINNVQSLIDHYWIWLKSKETLRQIDHQWIEINTPFLDRHNDYLQIYVGTNDSGFVLTDDAYIIHDLLRSGCDLQTPRRQAMLQAILNGFGVQRDGDALVVYATKQDFPLKKHSLVQAMLAVNDLFSIASHNVAGIFLEDVSTWFDASSIRYISNIKVAGKSGYDHLLNFVIPHSPQAPERIVQVANSSGREKIESIAFTWIDIRETRPSDARAYTMINDMDKSTSPEAIDALRKYGLTPILWSQRNQSISEFAA